MAFAATITEKTIMGNKRVYMGQYTQASGDTGGAITTGLKRIEYFDATGATKVTNASGVVTIVTADPGAAQTGYWMAIGY